MPHPVEYSDAVRLAIRKHLTALKEDLDKLEQTPHERIGQSVPRLGMHIGEAYVRPNDLSVGKLSLSIAMSLENFEGVK